MDRLTTDNPQSNSETAMNYCYVEDHIAKLRYAGGTESIPLHEYTSRCCKLKNCEHMTPEEVLEDGLMDCCDCEIAIMYYLGVQAVENNWRLKQYEDLNLSPDELTTKLAKLAQYEADEAEGCLLRMKKCPICGLINAPHGRKYCDRCGEILNPEAEAALVAQKGGE